MSSCKSNSLQTDKLSDIDWTHNKAVALGLNAVKMLDYKAVCDLKGLSYLGLSPAVQRSAGHKELPRFATSSANEL